MRACPFCGEGVLANAALGMSIYPPLHPDAFQPFHIHAWCLLDAIQQPVADELRTEIADVINEASWIYRPPAPAPPPGTPDPDPSPPKPPRRSKP